MISRESKLDYVDVVRGIAILMVILVHTAQRIPNLSALADSFAKYGQMGVQLFFVASAYTLCMTFEKREGESSSILKFYARRFFRIAPLYYIAILIYYVFNLIKLRTGGGEGFQVDTYTFENLMANLLLVHGLIPSAINTVVPGGWSIGTEIVFYLCFPFIFFVSRYSYKQKGFWALVCLFALFIGINLIIQLTFIYNTNLILNNNTFLYFYFINQLPVFMVGIAAYLYQKENYKKFKIENKFLILLFLIPTTLVMLLWRLDVDFFFSIIPTLSAMSFFCLIIYLKQNAIDNIIIRKIGKISFYLYIFHFIFVIVLIPLVNKYLSNILTAEVILLISFIVVLIPTYLIAKLTERHIEKKGILLGSKIIARVFDKKQGSRRLSHGDGM